ncbi:MAG: hypothetical protein CSB44_03225 [Gammaproteobacteria bacterium]|nr:MAG: hypothetical protein CSB44_03225 [Gammaproteobacteria bacterium]
MDIAELLAVNRIRCQCDIQSKKRVVQTVAEVLGASLRQAAERPGDEVEGDAVGVRENIDGKTEARTRNGEKHGEVRRLLSLRSRQSDADEAQEPPSDMDIMDALIARERLGATGIGKGVALPHSRLAGIEAPIGALLTLEAGVDYESGDGTAVDIVFGLLVPEQCNDTHLKILAELARRFNDDSLRDSLRRFESSEAVMGFLSALPATA